MRTRKKLNFIPRCVDQFGCTAGTPNKFPVLRNRISVVEDDGEVLTVNLCTDAIILRQGERKEPAVSNRHWRLSSR